MKKVILLISGMLLASGVHAATVDFFDGDTGQTTFDSLLTDGVTENFSGLTAVVTSGVGTTITLNDGTATISSSHDDNIMTNVRGGELADRVASGPESQSTTFSFGREINAFGGDFDLNPGRIGQGIQFLAFLNGIEVLASELTEQFTGAAVGFFGFISSSLFDTIVLTGGTQDGNGENYVLDNLQYGLADIPDVSEVPVPAALFLFAPALFGFFSLRRRSQLAAQM